MLLKLAYRNVFRNFRRSLLTFLAISIGISVGLLFIGVTLGFERQSIMLSVRTNTGHIKIHEKGYIDEELTLTLDYTIDNTDEVLHTLDAVPGITSTAERILFPASLTDGVDELRLNGIGINTERENEVYGLEQKLLRGEFLNPGEEKVLLTDVLADLFSVDTGESLTLIARTKYGAINALDLEIAGIVHVGNPEVDNLNFFIPLDIAQDFLEMDNMVTEIVVMGESMDTAEKLSSEIAAALSDGTFDIVTWEYMQRDLIRLYNLRARARWLLNMILLLMAGAGVMNTLLMSIFERTAEIGTLMAMGLRRKRIMLLFIFEGMFLGIFGSLVGCIVGGSVTYYFKFNGINIEVFGTSSFGNLPTSQYMYTEITLAYLAAAFVLGIVIAMLSAAYPATRGARLQPTEALRYV
ncbi:ABC transporter permease [candidate division KSB1 bacterium]